MIFKYIDLVGSQPVLYTDSNTRHKTVLGGLTSLLIIFLSILCFIAFGLDMLARTNPTLYESKVFNMTSELKVNDFSFVLGMMLGGGGTIPDLKKQVDVIVSFAIQNSSNVANPTNFTRLSMIPCSQSSVFKNNYLNITDKVIGERNNFYCLPDGYDESLMGQFGNPNFKIVELYVKFCNNATSNNICLPMYQINKNLALYFAQFMFIDNYYDLTDYEAPFKPYWRSDLIPLSSSSFRSDQYQFTTLDLTSDIGWILESNVVTKSYQLDSKSSSVLGTDGNYMLDLIMDIKNVNSHLTRRYSKLQQVVANTGGFIKFVTLVLGTIVTYISRFYFIENLYLKSYKKYETFHSSFFGNKDYSSNNSRIKINQIYVNPLQEQNQINIIPLTTVKFPIKNKNEESDVKDNTPKITTYSNLPSYFLCQCKSNRSKQIVKKLNDKFKKELDIAKIFKLTQKFKLSERFIYEKRGVKLKNLIGHHDIVNILDKEELQLEEDLREQLSITLNKDYIENLKTNSRVIDTNKLLYDELKKSNMI